MSVVAHSFGGFVTIELAKAFRYEFEDGGRVASVLFTDSVHSEELQGLYRYPQLMERLRTIG